MNCLKHKKIKNKLFLLFFLSTIFCGIAINQSIAQNENAIRGIYATAEQLFLRDELEASLAQLNTLIAKYKNSSDLQVMAQAYNLRGLIYSQQKNYNQALSEFEHALQLSENAFESTESAIHLVRYNLASTLYQNDLTEKASDLLTQIDPKLLDNDTRVRYYNLLGNTLSKMDRYIPAIVAFLIAANDLELYDTVAAEAISRKAYILSKKIYSYNALDDLEKLDSFESKMPKNSMGTWTLRLIMARGYSTLGRRTKAESLVDDFISSVPSHPLIDEAKQTEALFQKLSFVETNKVGLLLPLSGTFAKYGELSLNSLVLAMGIFQEPSPISAKNTGNIKFVIRDSGDTVESALKAFDQLVAEDHVVTVIGPLLSRQAVVVAQKAQEYGVPIFNLSQKHGVEQVGSYVFPIALTPNQQIQTIIQFVMKERGFKRFAILTPDNPSAEEYTRLFWDAVEANGGSVVAYESYATGSTDFRNEIKDLLGLNYLDARKMELEELKRQEDAYASKLKVRGVLRKRLLSAFNAKPIIDFDAIFVPDGPQAIGQIAPSFAIFDVKQIPFLGINTWNTAEIVRRAGSYLQNSFFVDSFYTNSRNKTSSLFVTEYQKAFGTLPGTLEVQAFDAGKIIIDTLANNSVSSRADFVQQIFNKKVYNGISGKFHFSLQGLERSAYLLGVKGNEILEIMPASLVK